MIKTYFNKDNLLIMTKDNGGLSTFKYDYFRNDFERWTKDLDISIVDVKDLEMYLSELGYNVLEIKEG